MKIKELFEGAEPNLPGAEPGILIMSMDQFLKYGGDGEPGGIEPGDMDEPEDEEDDEPKGVGREKRTDENKNWQDAQSGFYVYSKHTNKAVGGPYYSKRDIPEYFQNDKYKITYTPFSDEKELDEATKLPIPQRDFKGKELTDYMDRVRGTPKLDKHGNKTFNKDRITKKGRLVPGKEKYVSGKTKGDKFKLPYMHRNSVISYYSESGQKYNVDAIKQALGNRPKKLLKQNEKMKHSNGAYEQFFNIGFAALVGIALDESTGELIITNTCPGAGSCKVDCFAMKGGKVQFAGPWVSDGRILTFLLNDPDGFKAQLKKEIEKEYKDGKKGSKGFENGWNVTVRWHDAGDFFSPEYLDLAFDIARDFPEVKFYAYTKIASAALADKPENFIINWSEGAHTSQEKQIKAKDPELSHTKHSRIVPEDLFYDLLKKDAKGNLDKEGADAKGGGGRWQVRDASALQELKGRLAKAYGISLHSILSYDEWNAKTAGGKKETPIKHNVIIAPGEPDLTANNHGVLGTLLLKH